MHRVSTIRAGTAATLTAALLAAAASPASAAVLDFDDINVAGYESMPVGYGGFAWSAGVGGLGGWGVDNAVSDFSGGYDNPAPPSPDNVAFNWGISGDTTISLTRAGNPFLFDGAEFAGWGQNGSPAYWTAGSLKIEGYLDGALVGGMTFDLPTDQFLTSAGLSGPVDELRFLTLQWAYGGSPWVMDNFMYREVPPVDPGNGSRVPDGGATLAMLGLGVAGLSVMRSFRASSTNGRQI